MSAQQLGRATILDECWLCSEPVVDGRHPCAECFARIDRDLEGSR